MSILDELFEQAVDDDGLLADVLIVNTKSLTLKCQSPLQPGPCPENKPEPAKQEQPAATPKSRVGKVLSGFKAAVSKITDVPVLKQVKGSLNYLKKKQEQFQGVLAKRYGNKTAKAIMFSGMGIDAAVTGGGALLGKVIYIPGLSILGSLPAVVMAEGYKQLSKLRGKALEGELSQKQIEQAAKELHAQLVSQVEEYMKENKEAIMEIAKRHDVELTDEDFGEEVRETPAA